ncbi:DUF6412 domain-containing protein [Streptomyces sp. Rer75]|uniref:DUF6412 domain-containing protein n=1 Tax=unclassified Streptomyces TaxID=2593676 RepID=UPI0015CF9423|nr:DUF6412 domain-containing protein [Streptomyces sp. Rer75]QLH22075.1 hypothetical protein HYQ63_16865 [Streptomyces sp. Rer75]
MTHRFETLRMHLGVLLFLLTGTLLTQTGLISAVALAATAAVAAALLTCAVLAARARVPAPPGRIRTAIRDRERRTAFLPQRDPDAAGRPRPRAPGRRLPTAA